jgi:hypothetical protein
MGGYDQSLKGANMFKNIIQGGKRIFERAMTEKDFNSRFVFLGTFFVTSALMIGHFVVYAVGFLHGKPIDPAYPTVLGILGAGHGVNGLARFFTKKNGNGGGDGNGNGQPPSPDPNAPPPGLPMPGAPLPPQG